MKIKEPTHTTKVLNWLRDRDDFATWQQVMDAIKSNRNQTAAALFHLRKRRCIDCIIEPDGVAWWFALPPEEDNRSRHLDERVPESRPRNRRKKFKTGVDVPPE